MTQLTVGFPLCWISVKWSAKTNTLVAFSSSDCVLCRQCCTDSEVILELMNFTTLEGLINDTPVHIDYFF